MQPSGHVRIFSEDLDRGRQSEENAKKAQKPACAGNASKLPEYPALVRLR